jgi:serine/threonine protein kinase
MASSLSASYDRVGKLGEGTYGIVYKARDKKNQELVALKRMVPVSDAEGIPGTTMREIAFLRELKHPNIVDLKDVVFDVPKLTLVFECCEMDLAKYLRSKPNRQLPGHEIRLFMRQFLQGLAHMHSRSVLHRDLKPHNLLLAACTEEDGTVVNRLKVADFGLARIHGIPVKKYRHDAVTLWYRPPDLLLGSIMYGFSMDVWSAGCIFAEMISGAVLFQGKTEIEQLGCMFDMLGYPSKIHGSSTTPSLYSAVQPGSPNIDSNTTDLTVPQPPPYERSQSPRHTSPVQHHYYSTINSAMQSLTSIEDCDVFPSFSKLPNVEQVMEKGLAAKAKQAMSDPNWRPSFDEWVKKHSAVEKIGTDGVELLRHMLMLEPGRRITAADALYHPFLIGLAPEQPPPQQHQFAEASVSTSLHLSEEDPRHVWFPQAPLSAHQLLWAWAPFSTVDDDDFLSPDMAAVNAAVDDATSFMSHHRGIQRATSSHLSGNKIPVPPRRGGSLDGAPHMVGGAPHSGTVIPPFAAVGALLQDSPLRHQGGQVSRLLQGSGSMPTRALSGSWSTTQEATMNQSNTKRPGTNSMVHLEPLASDQDALSHTSGGTSTGFAISLTRDAFLQSYGPNSSTATTGQTPLKSDDKVSLPYRLTSDDRLTAGQQPSALSSPAPPASTTTTATPTDDEPHRSADRHNYNDIMNQSS